MLQRVQVHVLPGLEQRRELVHNICYRGVLGLFFLCERQREREKQRERHERKKKKKQSKEN